MIRPLQVPLERLATVQRRYRFGGSCLEVETTPAEVPPTSGVTRRRFPHWEESKLRAIL